MIRTAPILNETPPALQRLSRISPLSDDDSAALVDALDGARRLPVRRELMTEGHEITGSLLLASGWAARVRLLSDGRRQFLSFLLPGDLIGLCHQSRPLAVSTVVALSEVTYCAAPSTAGLPGLAEAYAVSQALEEGYLLNQIVRLGRLNAQDRIADLMLELHERLELAGLADGRGFAFPLTQEVLADALGLTSVHINRTLQILRRDGDIETRSGGVRIPDLRVLATKIGRTSLRVTANS